MTEMGSQNQNRKSHMEVRDSGEKTLAARADNHEGVRGDEDDQNTTVCQQLPPAQPVSNTERSLQPMQSPEGKPRRNVINLPVINVDRLRAAKTMADKAVRMRKVFSIQGPYPVVRAALRARGWVERRLPRPNKPWARRRGDEEAEGNDGEDSDDDEDDDEQEEKEEDPDDLHNIMSRMVRNEMTYFYWTTRRDAVDCHSFRKDQMINHYAKAATFTTKVGLCVNLRNLRWFDDADPDTFFPRCYRLGAEDEKHAFIDDFRRTACTSLLQCVVERSRGEKGERGEEREGGTIKSPGQSLQTTTHCDKGSVQRRPCKRQAMSAVPSKIIDSALQVCQEFLDSLEHSDIDVALETEPTLTEQQWSEFLHSYYLVVHEGCEIENSGLYVNSCNAMLRRLREVCPQLDSDGIHNIWIIKPGAKSRGRGIMCVKRLDEILKLVDSDPVLIKDSKWVVQKYLERPYLVHGTKFDLRQWFLVTDWNPLTVWFYKKCYLRFSTQPYSVDILDSSVHLCNNSIQKHFQPSQQRQPEVPADNMWSCEQFRAFLASQRQAGQWGNVVIPGMKKAVIHALQTAQDAVESRRGSFELYGADFMLGRDLRPWLIEINASPTMAPSTAVTARLCAAVQEDTLRVVLDRRLDRGANTGGFQLIYKQAAVEVPQYVGVNLLVEGSKIKRPRPPPQKAPGLFEPRSNQSGASTCRHRAFGKENKTGPEKPKAAPKRWMNAVARQLNFSSIKIQAPCFPHRSAQIADPYKLQQALAVDTPQSPLHALTRSLDCPWYRPLRCSSVLRSRSGLGRPINETDPGPNMPLEIFSLQDRDRTNPGLVSRTLGTGFRLHVSRHHNPRVVHGGCAQKRAQNA